jgi:hypothetical protein
MRTALLSVLAIGLSVLAAISVPVTTVFAASAADARVAASYTMSFDNTTYGETASGSLTDIKENGAGHITGYMTVDAPLGGSGDFTGTVSGATVKFSVSGGYYAGKVNKEDTSIRGTYSYPSLDQVGTWQATISSPVGIYANLPKTASVETALNDGWPLIANHSALSGPAHCKGNFTGAGSDKTIVAGLTRYETANNVTVPWLSFWTVDAPPVKPYKPVSAYEVGLAAGRHAAKEILNATALVNGSLILPTYVVLDPEGQACGNPGKTNGEVWNRLSLATWQNLVSGWETGIADAELTPRLL